MIPHKKKLEFLSYQKHLIVLLFFFFPISLLAQDTLKLNMVETDSLFLTKNLDLLAQKYKMDMNRANTIQARLFDNPTLNTEWNLYNPNKKKFIDAGPAGEKIIALEQIIHLAGQRNKRVQIAKENEIYGEFEFYDLLRTLKFELRNNFQTYYFNQLTIKKYDEQLNLLDTIIQALSFQSNKGNIPLKEVLRLKAVYFQLNTDRTELFADLMEAQKNLKTLLQTNAYLDLKFSPNEQEKYKLLGLKVDSLLQKGIQNRPDLKMAQSMVKQSELNYALQKRLAIPDMRIGGIYDQAGSYISQYSGITIGLDLPVWNRNQGNIKMAKANQDYMSTRYKNKNNEVGNEVLSTYLKLVQIDLEYKKVDTDFGEKFDEINDGFVTNFHKRNISMLEFVDFFESYNASIMQINKLTEKRIKAYEELNYVIGEELFK